MTSFYQKIISSIRNHINDTLEGKMTKSSSLQSASIFAVVYQLNEKFTSSSKIFTECVLKCCSDPNIAEKLLDAYSEHFKTICEAFHCLLDILDDHQTKDELKSNLRQYAELIIEFLGGLESASTSKEFEKRASVAKTSYKIVRKSKEIVNLSQSSSPSLKKVLETGTSIRKLISNLESTILLAESGSLTETKSTELVIPSTCSKQIFESMAAVSEKVKILSSSSLSDSVIVEILPIIMTNLDTISQKVISYAVFLGSENKQDQLSAVSDVKAILVLLNQFLDAIKSCSSLSSPSNALMAALQRFNSNFTTIEKKSDSKISLGKSLYTLKAAMDAILEPKYASASSFTMKTPQELSRLAKKISDTSSKVVKISMDKKKIELEKLAASSLPDFLDFIDQIRVYYTALLNDQAALDAVKSTRECMKKYCKLMETSNAMISASNDSECRQKLTMLNKEITEMTISLAKSTSTFKTINSDGTTVLNANEMAKIELENAVKAIEAAAEKLEQIKPRSAQKGKGNAEEDMQWDEQILEASKFITSAVKTLTSAAKNAQRDVKCSESSGGRIVSAARLVSESIDNLTEAVKKVISGKEGSRSQLAEAAKSVADATNKLISSCRNDSDQKMSNSLEAAGSAVKQATETLAHALRNLERSEKKTTSIASNTVDPDTMEELALMELICQKEAALKDAKQMMADFEEQLAATKATENNS